MPCLVSVITRVIVSEVKKPMKTANIRIGLANMGRAELKFQSFMRKSVSLVVRENIAR